MVLGHSEVAKHNGALVYTRYGSSSEWDNLDQLDSVLQRALPPGCHHRMFSGLWTPVGVTARLRAARVEYGTADAAATHEDLIVFMRDAFDSTLDGHGSLLPRPRSMVLCDGVHYRVLLFSPSDVAYGGSNVLYLMDSLWGPSGWEKHDTAPLLQELRKWTTLLDFKLVVRRVTCVTQPLLPYLF